MECDRVRYFIYVVPENHWHNCPAICGKAIFPSNFEKAPAVAKKNQTNKQNPK